MCSNDAVPEFIHGNMREEQPFNDQASLECFSLLNGEE